MHISSFEELCGKFLVAYIRVSSDKQDGGRQRENISTWADKYGLSISKWYEDTQGRNPRDLAEKRLDFQRLLKDIEGGTIDAVVVDSLDRFGVKDAHEFGYYVHQLRKNGVELWSIMQGNISAADPGTILTSTLGAITSTNEQVEKAHRSLDGKRRKALAGEYVGGYPQYGFDVVCFGADGDEKWRLVWIGHYRRIKISPNGKEELYEGKDNSPAHDRNDSLRYRPSIKTERLEMARQIFAWYVQESISPSRIATRLNKMKVDPVFGDAWNKQKIKQLLKHPIYIGFPTVNKRGSGRHKEFVDGEERPVPQVNGRTKAGRNRAPEDWWQPSEREFEPVVPVELFEQAQAKTKESSQRHHNPKKKPPRTASFWLRNLLICAKCGKPMRAWNATENGLRYRSYFCATYGTYGKINPTGCRSNRTKAEVLERLVEKYLADTNQQIASLIKAQESGDFGVMGPLIGELIDKFKEVCDVQRRMTDQTKVIPQNWSGSLVPRPNLASFFSGDFSDCGVYGLAFEEQKPVLEARLIELDAEQTALVEKFMDLPKEAKRAITKVKKRLVQLEAEIEAVTSRLENLQETFNVLLAELVARKNATEAARQSIHSDTAYRRKSELVRQVIDQIVCHFRDTDGRGNQPRSILERVEVIPVSGEQTAFYPNGTSPARG